MCGTGLVYTMEVSWSLLMVHSTMIRRLGPWSGVSCEDPISGHSSCTGYVLGVDWDDHERVTFPILNVEDLEDKP